MMVVDVFVMVGDGGGDKRVMGNVDATFVTHTQPPICMYLTVVRSTHHNGYLV